MNVAFLSIVSSSNENGMQIKTKLTTAPVDIVDRSIQIYVKTLFIDQL